MLGLEENLKGLLYFWSWNFSICGGYLLFVPLTILQILNPRIHRKISDFVVTYWQYYVTTLLIRSNCQVHVTGDPISSEEMSIVISNHRTRVDWNFLWPVMYHSVQGKQQWWHSTKFVLKNSLRNIPPAGWMMQMAMYIFINRNWEKDKPIIDDYLEYVEDTKYKHILILFPEGTDLTPETKKRSNEFAIANNLPTFENLLYPRTTGFSYMVDEMRQRKCLDAVYDLTLIYPDNCPQDEKQLFVDGKFPKQVVAHLVRYPISALPDTKVGLKDFLEKRWLEKEQIIEEFKRTGQLLHHGQKLEKNESLTFRRAYITHWVWIMVTAALLMLAALNKLTSDRSADNIPGTEGISLIEPDDQEKQLWVDLYKPTKYIELLSDESTNRTTLKWIKLWDKVVFNKNPKIKVALQKPDGKMNAFKFNELNTDLDEYGRPHHKVVLLCGPPGLGKTTLAHMVAKHAGYRVVEINASDDRNIDAFRTALENATQMRSVIDEQRRPNCIVFDEIDGAPQASIDFLVKFITGNVAVKGKKSKAKDKEHHILKRPIICICNDVYVPALRPLRQIAFVINFPHTSSARLAERLMEIAKRQDIKTDLGAMMALAEKSNNDVRTCISVLHFYKAQNKQIGLTDIYKVNVGQKDMQKGLFSVWNDIFEIKRVRKHEGGTTTASAKERTQTILNTMSSFGDHERVAQGIYENFPRLKIKDPGLNGTSCALDWFCYNDMITKQIHEIHNYSLMNYLNYAFVVWHFVFGSFQRAKLTYPSMGYEMRMKETRQKALVAEVLRGMTSSVRCYHSALPLVLDVFPLLLRIIAPSFKPVNVHLYTEEDRRELLRVASVMTDYNLNYIQERKADGVYEFILEPNIEELVTFGKSKTTIRKLTYSNRQLVAREIEVEKVRRFESMMQKKSDVHTTEKPVVHKQSKALKEDNNSEATMQTDLSLPNHLQTLQYKALDSSSKSTKIAVRKDFFGRIIQTTRASLGKGTRDALSNDIWFLYKEGYSNAVKKRVKVKDLK